jgi:hypothetical protein
MLDILRSSAILFSFMNLENAYSIKIIFDVAIFLGPDESYSIAGGSRSMTSSSTLLA